MTYQEGGWEKLCQLYPILTEQQLRGDKVRNSNETRPVTHVKLNQDNWKQVKELWRDFSKRRMIVFDDGAVDISQLMDQIFLDETHYVVEYSGMIRESLVAGIVKLLVQRRQLVIAIRELVWRMETSSKSWYRKRIYLLQHYIGGS